MDQDDYSYDWYDDRSYCDNCSRATMDLMGVEVYIEDPDNPWHDMRIIQNWCFWCRQGTY